VEEASKVSSIPLIYPVHSQYKKNGKIVTVNREFIVNKDILKDSRLSAFVDQSTAKENGCYYLNLKGHQKRLGFMIAEGKIKRIDIWDLKITTLSGAKVEDSEERIKELYGNKIKVEPHKFIENGHYLIYVPKDKSDQNYRVIFETDGTKVTNFRAGLLPEVEYVEGCL
ncbi:MAG: hypothetical protein SFU25_04275, partial [Candidatus Caenarcaniphilales bacterium]|nr:hypothetical protein [Candidatus Caenarcaniphilales bacterium]